MLKILLTSVGTRGDIEPFLAIGQLLKEKGHMVTCCFPEQFRQRIETLEINFMGLGSEYLEMVNSKDGKIVMGNRSNPFVKVKAYYNLYRRSSVLTKAMALRQREILRDLDPNLVIFHIKSVYPLIWALENPKKAILVSPIPYLVHFTKEHGHLGFNGNFGTIINKLSYRLANYALLRTVQSVARHIDSCDRITLGLLKRTLFNMKMAFTISPAMMEVPNYWPKHVRVLGHYQRKGQGKPMIADKLEGFLDRNDNVLFVTFGSMVNEHPKKVTEILVKIVQEYRIPTVINTSEGGLIQPESYDPEVLCFVSEVYYDLIFPRIHAVIHHGGSGTTHLAMKHGCPSLVIPHIIDQHMWANKIYQMGAGPKGIPIRKLTIKKLEKRLLDLYQNNIYKVMAEKLSMDMAKENLEEELTQFLTNG